MKFIIKRRYTDRDVEVIRKSIRKKIGRFEKVSKLLKIKKCTDPDIGEMYLYLLAIRNDEPISEEIIIEDAKIFAALTPKRFEIIEIVNRFGPLSIKNTAKKLSRDYKNVYDDVFSLYRFFIINLIRMGKEKYIVGKTERFVVDI